MPDDPPARAPAGAGRPGFGTAVTGAPAAPPGPVSAAATVVLHGLTTADHRISLGARDRAALAPLI
ncbi:hypothetical protein OG689_20430 [Kitasatospora sp. NBC_00240]|uniref:hypothetical protein n=1 Tax=Kitasatospora sp. NBC_00240 TaxID=2903567 RepID=UPI002256F5C4|nr:hypothetical protein [Kitasatospora sp. NBC_00240]MCX5211627.1 hypothetical protein [Kitasatospora sp. NBC_00240]